MFKKLLKAINEAEERELEENSFDMMMEDFDFDEELSEGFFSNFIAKKKAEKEARRKEHERLWTEAHNESNRLRAKFRSRIPESLRKFLDISHIKDDDEENLTIFDFDIPDEIILDNDKYKHVSRDLDAFIKQLKQASTHRLWVHADDEIHSIRVDTAKKQLSESQDELSEGFFQRIKDRANSHNEAKRLRDLFIDKIPSKLRPYLNNDSINDSNKINNVIFNFAVSDKLAFKDSNLYDELLDIMKEFGKEIEKKTEFKTRIELSGEDSIQLKISSKRQ